MKKTTIGDTPYWMKAGTEATMDNIVNLLFHEPEIVKQKVRENVKKSIERGEDYFTYPEDIKLICPLTFLEYENDVLLIYARMVHQQFTIPEEVEQQDCYTDAVVDHLYNLIWDPEFDRDWCLYFGEVGADGLIEGHQVALIGDTLEDIYHELSYFDTMDQIAKNSFDNSEMKQTNK